MISPSELRSCVFCLRDSHQIALTFDDGPNQPYTNEVLELLEKYGAKATFFVIGEWVESQAEVVRNICVGGHAIGNHSYSHDNLENPKMDRTAVQSQLEKCQRAIDEALKGIGASRSLFRAPYGRMGGNVLSVARTMGLQTVYWSLDPHDYDADPRDNQKPMGADTIVRQVSAQIDLKERGEIILLHDGCTRDEAADKTKKWRADRSNTVKATKRLLKMYLGRRQFVALGPEVEMVEVPLRGA
jgi:peptidoglycan/xylan/chitin deacetylase (PgdA/CDA1 family)